METLEVVKAWADVVSSLGVTGILAVFIVLFFRGEILSKRSVETIISNVTMQIKEFFRDELKEALDNKVKDKKGVWTVFADIKPIAYYFKAYL